LVSDADADAEAVVVAASGFSVVRALEAVADATNETAKVIAVVSDPVALAVLVIEEANSSAGSPPFDLRSVISTDAHPTTSLRLATLGPSPLRSMA